MITDEARAGVGEGEYISGIAGTSLTDETHDHRRGGGRSGGDGRNGSEGKKAWLGRGFM